MNQIDKLIADNVRLVFTSAFTQDLNTPYEKVDTGDIHSEGLIGLWKAAQTFDASKGFAFSTYAHRCIQHSVGKYLEYWSRQSRRYDMHIQMPENMDIVEDSDFVKDVETSDFIARLLLHLTEIEAAVFQDRFVRSLTFPEIAKKHKWKSPQAANFHYAKALKKLRTLPEIKGLAKEFGYVV